MIHIYGLVESGKQVGQIRYIGITTDPTDSLQRVADALNITSKTTVNNDLKWLERQGVVHVDRTNKPAVVQVNGHYEQFVNGG